MSTPFLHKAVGFNIFLPCLEKSSLSTRVCGRKPRAKRGNAMIVCPVIGLFRKPHAKRGNGDGPEP